jgi:hypothetical protein
LLCSLGCPQTQDPPTSSSWVVGLWSSTFSKYLLAWWLLIWNWIFLTSISLFYYVINWSCSVALCWAFFQTKKAKLISVILSGNTGLFDNMMKTLKLIENINCLYSATLFLQQSLKLNLFCP